MESVAEHVIGRKGARRRNEWFDNECQIALDAKNAARTKYLQRATRATQEDYRKKRAEERRLFRRKKVQQEQVLIVCIEHLSSVKDVRGLYQTVKDVKSGYNHQPLLCKDAGGELLADEESCIARWTEYFKDLLNSEASPSPVYHQTRSSIAQLQPQHYIKEPTVQEVQFVVSSSRTTNRQGRTTYLASF